MTCYAFRIVDRRASYFARAAISRAADSMEHDRRYVAGKRIQAGLYAPKVVVKSNVTELRRKAK